MRVRGMAVLCAALCCVIGAGVRRARAQSEKADSRARDVTVQLGAQDSASALSPSRAGGRRISLDLRDVALKDALRAIAVQSGVTLFYNDRDLPSGRFVSITVTNATAADALRLVLSRTGMTARATTAGIVLERTRRTIAPDEPADSTGSISGSITDATTGGAVTAATVLLINTSFGTTSGDDGRFHIAGVEPGTYTMIVRRIGYREASRRIVVSTDRETVADFSLVSAPHLLDEIVTTATGDQRRREVGNLIATIQADSVVATAPVTSLAQVLAGRVAGVQVLFTGGLTGVSSPINIRGQNSFSLSNQPLLVVDGVRVDNTTTGPSTAPTFAGLNSGRFNDLDPNDIESIEVVKGPSAATLYGTDAANGVILVTTKKGKAGPPRWSAFAEGGTLTFDRDRFPTSYFPWGHATTGSAAPIRCTLLTAAAGTCTRDSVTSFSPLRNAETTPIGSGSRHSVGVQVAGGAAIRYLLSGTVESETGYLKMPSADRTLLEKQASRGLTADELHPNGVAKYDIRSNFTVPFSHVADLGISAAVSHSTIRIPDPTALLFGGVSTGVRDKNDGWTFGNRAGDYLIKRDRESVTHFTGGLTGNWHPNSWLAGRLTTGLDLSSDYIDRLVPAGLGFTASTLRGSRENTKVNIALQTVDAGLSMTLPLRQSLTSRTAIGVQYNRRTALSNTAAAQNLTPGAETVAGGVVPVVGESTIETVVAGTYVEETVGWHDRLYLTGATRIDGASSFGKGFRAAVYPKASLSWLLSEEPFWPRIPGVTSLRLRAAYGQSGVQPGPVAALQAETLFPAVVGGTATTGARLGAIGNRDLRPERQREVEGGLDLELLDGRFAVQATYYDKRSTDALVSVALPASFGGGTQWQNVGAVRNRGYEGLINARLLAMPRLSWSVTLNGSVNDNTVLAIAPTIDAIYNSGTTAPSLVRGYPSYSYFDYPIESVADANGDGIIEPDEITVGDTREFAGSAYPRTQFSGTTTLGLFGERVKLGATVEHRGGYAILNIAESLRCALSACAGTALTSAPLAAQAAAVARGTAALHGTYWGFYEDGSFTRLRELSITYALPSAVAGWLRMRDASVTLSGRNLALWSAYSGTDPEVYGFPGGIGGMVATFDRTGVPAPTYWLLRINLDL